MSSLGRTFQITPEEMRSLPSGVVKSMRRSMTSRRVSWPPMMLSHRGAVASSKSAMQADWIKEITDQLASS